MTIHHDKMAYGKLASMKEDLSEEALLSILSEINEQYEDENNNSNSIDEAKEENDK